MKARFLKKCLFLQLVMLSLVLGMWACGGERPIGLPGCELCPERCSRSADGVEQCVECLTDGHCNKGGKGTKKCVNKVCVCGSDQDCPKDLFCAVTDGCSECGKDAHCKDPSLPVCSSGKCVTCRLGDSRSCFPVGVKPCN